MADKEKVVTSLLATGSSDSSSGGKGKVLVEEVDEKGKVLVEEVPAKGTESTSDDGPSLMEQMMAAQQQAKKKEDIVKAKAKAKEDKKALGGGFKKGFFGGGSSGDKAKSKKSTPTTTKEGVKTGGKEQGNDSIPTITAKKGSAAAKGAVVLEDVQKALKEEEESNPLLKQLKGGEWATEDLMGQLQSNPVLLRGLQNPKCQAAIQLMQTDPQEAKRRFEKDPEVSAFMQAFSTVMASHFTRLGEQQQQQPPPPQQQQSIPIPSGSVEVGPLHAEAIERQKKQGGSGSHSSAITEVNREEEARVQEIVEDEELRNMLMDPKLQQVLKECNDPVKFQAYMRDPVIAYKIKKLFDAGLVGTAK